MKKMYSKPTVNLIIVETEGSILAGSVETVDKNFKVKTGEYETDNNWFGNNATFNVNFE